MNVTYVFIVSNTLILQTIRMAYPMLPSAQDSMQFLLLAFVGVISIAILKVVVRYLLLNHCMKRLPVIMREVRIRIANTSY